MQKGLERQEKNPLMKLGIRLAGKRMFREYPYEELYFLEQAKRVRERVQCGLCYIGGVCSTESIRTVMAEGFDFVQLGRGLLYDPDFPKNAQSDAKHVNGCSHCNLCATLIDAPGGILCVEKPANFTPA